MSYRVFARKYRPQTFDEVVGQEHITRTLQNAISAGRVAQAYLFVGPRGIGKTSTARILAKALNCVNGPTATPCGVCDACKEIAEGRSLDVLEIDGASNNGVENIRELRDNAAYAPARGPFKVYLIDEVHMLSAGAFNALLKTLEEPPEHVKFIFATTEAQKVPATITSRCQRFDLRRIPTDSISAHLQDIARKENITMEPAAADAIARAAEGGLRDAESMLDQSVAFCGDNISATDVMSVFGFTPREVIHSLLDHVLARDAAAALAVIAGQAEAGRDLSRLLADLISLIRDELVAGVAGASAAPREKLLLLLDLFAETEARMRWATDKKLQFDVATIKAVHILDQASLDDVLTTLSALSRGEALPPAPPRPAPSAAPARPAPVAQAPAAPPKPEPKPTPAPISVPAPAPAASAPPAPPAPPVSVSEPLLTLSEEREEKSIDAAIAWENVARTYETSIKYRWLTKGVFALIDADSVLVQLPPSEAKELASFLGEMGRKDAEQKLSAALNRKLTLRLEIGEHLTVVEEIPEPEPEPTPAPEAKAPEPEPAAPQAPAGDPMDDFKNDPLIKKALEIFRGEIQTATK
ncbi:MAG: DNA polymerase III, subunit gamma and tau [Verrucomicrobia bacterium 61-8]|nr:MAG: DNA polymerase III, subunit gamma and tau [Verrucomicrobia bacterium 61-8]